MLNSENCILLCSNCPNRDYEGTTIHDPITGSLVSRQPKYMNARLEFVKDPTETPDIPTQEFAVTFVDTEGNRTSPFLPGVELSDIASCDKPVVSKRSGFMHRKKHYDCGAQALRLLELRKRTNKNTF